MLDPCALSLGSPTLRATRVADSNAEGGDDGQERRTGLAGSDPAKSDMKEHVAASTTLTIHPS